MRKWTWLLPLVLTLVAVATAALLPGSATSAVPASGTISPASTSVSWQGGPAVVSNPSGVCVGGVDVTCDRFLLTITPPPTGNYSVEITLTASNTDDDWDLFVFGPDGTSESSTKSAPNYPEVVRLNNPAAGTWRVYGNPWLVNPGSTYSAAATMTVDKVYPPSSTGSVLYDFDAAAPQAKLEAPLRVVAVGFKPGELDASKVLGEIPNIQRPGVLIPRGTDPGPDNHPLIIGNEGLLNHGRAYFDNSSPFLVPYEYTWKPQLIYAPDTFTNGLLAAMASNSATGEFAKSGNRQYIEKYNAERGVYRGSGNQVAPNAPVRFVDGEAVENWVAANSQAMLGWSSGPRGGKGKKAAGVNPGYTVYVINTWDSAAAKTHLKPEHEYHVFKINRKDPDTGEFDGIDWARVWGGNYRFMMVDLGAAPNPYESETWGNRNRTVLGSAAYDPPLWEYRANAPRPVTVINAPTQGVEQALTPGETWDANQMNFMLGRTVNQAASFRFLHSYLYEPWPATGQYWFSDNVWHDANAQLPWASDLTKLYNQDVVLAGLRTLTPYLTFQGDAKFQYLQQGGPDYSADQAMLEQAKRDGSDASSPAPSPGTAMRTTTAMDYLDSKPSRFLRGGPCFTTVPGINVVAEKHYAWYLAIAAGIATNRNGTPWGYLNSVNDVFKSGSADQDQTLRLAHPTTATGAFSYTAIHEASHYLGLAHPHDSIGATRRADGSPRYYDGFVWTYNSTAAPTTYSHTELTYSILDQDNIARGHAAYYLKWTDEALQDGGRAFYDAGKQTLAAIPPSALSLRNEAISMAAKAEAAFAKWDFANAVFAAQAAYRAAAAYRDEARGLPPGTTELERGTKKTGAEACPSAKK
jgi:hypothetical protein